MVGSVVGAHDIDRRRLIGCALVAEGEGRRARDAGHGADHRRPAQHVVARDADGVVRRGPAQRRAARNGRRSRDDRPDVRRGVVDDRGRRDRQRVAGVVGDDGRDGDGAVGRTLVRAAVRGVPDAPPRRREDGSADVVQDRVRARPAPLDVSDAGRGVGGVGRERDGRTAHDGSRSGSHDRTERERVVDDNGCRRGRGMQRVVRRDVADVIGAVCEADGVPCRDLRPGFARADRAEVRQVRRDAARRRRCSRP